MKKLAIPVLGNEDPAEGNRADTTPCENCLCASCEKLCMQCVASCSPMEGRHIPLIGCPGYVNMRTLSPLRYTVRGGADIEYRLHLKLSAP